MTTPTSLATADASDLARPATGLVLAEDWCKANGLSQQTTDKIIEIQKRKAIVDLEYMLMIGELIKEIRRTLDNGLGDKCCEEVLGIPRRTARRYEAIYEIKQAVPELNQSSVELIGVMALSNMQTSRQSYELAEEEKRAIITAQEAITERQMKDLKEALGREALKEQRDAVKAAKEALEAAYAERLEAAAEAQAGVEQAIADAKKTLEEERNTLKLDIGKLAQELREARSKLPTDTPAETVVSAVMDVPVPGSVSDRVTPSLTYLKEDPTGQALVKDTREPLMNWMASNRKAILKSIKEFNAVYDAMHRDFHNQHFGYQLLWEGIDIISPTIENRTRWESAFGKSRRKTLDEMSVELHEFASRIKRLPDFTSMGNDPFRVED